MSELTSHCPYACVSYTFTVNNVGMGTGYPEYFDKCSTDVRTNCMQVYSCTSPCDLALLQYM